MAKFPSPEWVSALEIKLNSDEQYARIAHNWEGDMLCQIEADDTLKESLAYYLDLWHGKCRQAFVLEDGAVTPKFVLRATYGIYRRLLKGELEPMQALLTRKINVQGSMAVFVRNVPTVLDFVRCCREVTDSFI